MSDVEIELQDLEGHRFPRKNPLPAQSTVDKTTGSPPMPRFHVVAGTFLGTLCAVVALAISFIILIFVIVWLIVGSVAFDMAFSAGPPDKCERLTRGNTPSKFHYYGSCSDVRNRPELFSFFEDYYVPESDVRSVTFHTRPHKENMLHVDANLSAWALTHNSAPADHPWIISVHGISVCKANYAPLLHSGMLWHAGYNIMVIDLRNHGDSAKVADNYVTYGSQEHFDVLGAFDYLAELYPAAPIGVIGQSMGGATAMIAYAREPKFQAAFIDSGVCDVYETILDNARQILGWGELVMSAVCAIGSTKSIGCPTFTFNPVQALQNDTFSIERPIFFQHGVEDTLVPISNAQKCSAIAEQKGMQVYRHYSNVPYEGCNPAHVLNIVADPEAFYDRMTGFFTQHIPL